MAKQLKLFTTKGRPKNSLTADEVKSLAAILYGQSQVEKHTNLTTDQTHNLRFVPHLKDNVLAAYYKIRPKKIKCSKKTFSNRLFQQLLEAGYLVLKDKDDGSYYVFLDRDLARELQPQIEGN